MAHILYLIPGTWWGAKYKDFSTGSHTNMTRDLDTSVAQARAYTIHCISRFL